MTQHNRETLLADSGGAHPTDRAFVADAIEPVPVSPVPASIPCAWHFTVDGHSLPNYHALIYALGRFGDVYGPLPVEMFAPAAWDGCMGGGSP